MLLENTVRCNVDCTGCARETAAHLRVDKQLQMPLPEMESMADLMSRLGMRQIFYLNLGEPFLSPTICEELPILRRKNPDCRIVTSTNGVLLNTDAKREAAARQLLAYWMGPGYQEFVNARKTVSLQPGVANPAGVPKALLDVHASLGTAVGSMQALAVAKEVLRRARAGEDFARLAIEFSDEPGAGGRGGSLGRFGHGQMVPAFEAAAFKLAVGEISDIVESGFGYHVIQRTE